MTHYHVALARGYTPRTQTTLYVQIAHDIDFLSCEIWKYMGYYHITQSEIKSNFHAILKKANEHRPKDWPEFKKAVLQRA